MTNYNILEVNNIKFSHSRVETFNQCPYRFKLQYLDEFTTLSDYDPSSPLTVGVMVHSAIEKNLKEAINEYYRSYPIISDAHINEAYKLETLYPNIMAILQEAFPGKWEHEVIIEDDNFKGFIDLVVHNDDGTVNIVDFKYSNNIDNYMKSGQLHEYKYFYEKQYKKTVKHLLFLFIPKTQIKQKQEETTFEFRKRIVSELSKMNVQIREVPYDANKVVEFAFDIKKILEEKEFAPNPTYLCGWCNFKGFCQENKTYDIIKKESVEMLPSSERRVLGERKKKKIWIYGVPTSGKTTMCDDAPNPLNLNTDGNIEDVTMPYLSIKDVVIVEGRVTKRKLAWEVFKDTITELEKKQNDFKTVMIDLVEDTREMCRLYKYEELGIQHESDSTFGKGWDIIKTEYLSTMRRYFNLDYENLIIISHEDCTKDVTKKNGDKITRIAPNIPEPIANKLAGMVDLVVRAVKENDGTRMLQIPNDEITFGGTRLKGVNVEKMPLSWDNLMKIYDLRNETVKTERRAKKEEKQGEQVEEEQKEEQKNFTEEVQETKQTEEKVEQAETVKRTRKPRN